MAGLFDGVDMADPCAVWPILNKILLERMAGKTIERSRYGPDEVFYARGDIDELRKTVSQLRAECEARTTGKKHRRAFTAGFR